MKIVRFEYRGKTQYGMLAGDDLRVLAGDIFDHVEETGQTVALTDAKILPPVNPSKVICLGLNYRKHAQELNLPMPPAPLLFMKPPTSVIGHLDSIVSPDQSRQVDYEGEMVLVIGRKAHKVPEAEALRYVFGCTAANDVTARDLTKLDGQWTRGKSFDTFCPLGPVIATGLDPDNLKIETRLNGKSVQSSSTGDLIYKCAHLVSFISEVMTLLPGDVILTGTPSGIGPMVKGDQVEVEVEGIGVLKNFVG